MMLFTQKEAIFGVCKYYIQANEFEYFSNIDVVLSKNQSCKYRGKNLPLLRTENVTCYWERTFKIG